MSNYAILIEHLGKQYRIGMSQKAPSTFREVMHSFVRAPLHYLATMLREPGPEELIWALDDISLSVEHGEVLGIIGRNGAGKSTLLKILSRITEPTTGQIKLYGRIGSLLEVGTGFHPELTGRENIYLNGTILGMRRADIDKQFDEIVDFSGVEKFLDTPVKRYSSGMYVRLAFAVAAHLNPDILLVDEVLAVGDLGFQKKCLEKMHDVSESEGRTVVFVSHQLAAIEKLCSRTAVISNGKLVFCGETRAAIHFYSNTLDQTITPTVLTDIEHSGTREILLTRFYLENAHGALVTSISCGDDVTLVFAYTSLSQSIIKNVSIGLSIHSPLGEYLSVFYSDYAGITFSALPRQGTFKCRVKDFPYSPGKYLIAARIVANGIEIDCPKGYVGAINVEAGDFYGTGRLGQSNLGPFLIRGNWELHADEG